MFAEKKPSIFFACKNKNFERKKEKNKVFSLCSPKFLQCYPVTTRTPAQFLPRTQRTRITGYILRTEYNFTEELMLFHLVSTATRYYILKSNSFVSIHPRRDKKSQIIENVPMTSMKNLNDNNRNWNDKRSTTDQLSGWNYFDGGKRVKRIDAHRNLQLIIRSLNCRTHFNVYPLLLNVNSRLDFSSKFQHR